MARSLIHEPIAKLPIYIDGFRRGTDLGLRIALETIVAAGYDQERRAHRTSPPAPANAHAATVLRAVADQVAVRSGSRESIFRRSPRLAESRLRRR